MNTKPSEVQVGQVWQHKRSTGPRTVVEFDRGTATFDTRSIGFESSMLKDPDWTYLGPPPSPVSGGMREPPTKPGLGQIWRHHDCDGGTNYELTGDKVDVGLPWWLITKENGSWSGQITKDEVARSWTFVRYADVVPRLPQPSQGAPTVIQTPWLKVPPSPYYRAVGEIRSQDGRPLSALEAIAAKKKPEPYICPVDDWDLLPDAGR